MNFEPMHAVDAMHRLFAVLDKQGLRGLRVPGGARRHIAQALLPQVSPCTRSSATCPAALRRWRIQVHHPPGAHHGLLRAVRGRPGRAILDPSRPVTSVFWEAVASTDLTAMSTGAVDPLLPVAALEKRTFAHCCSVRERKFDLAFQLSHYRKFVDLPQQAGTPGGGQ